MSTLIVLGYPSEAEAKSAYQKILDLDKNLIVSLQSVAVVARRADGKYDVVTPGSKVGTSAVWGLFWGVLFGLLFWRCYRIIMRQTELRDRLTAFGLTVILAMGAVMNLAVVMGVAPPKGVPMPLMSYGGSNLMATMLCVGLLMNFSRTATGKEGSIWKESS